MGKLADQIRTALDAKRAEVAEAWKAYESRRDELLKDDGEVSAELLDELDALHATYKGVADEEETLEGQWEKAVKLDGDGYQRKTPEGEPERKDNLPVKQTRIWTPGQRFVESDAYKQLVGSGTLRTERARVATSPVEVWTQEEVKNLPLLAKQAPIMGSDLQGTLIQPDRGTFQPFPLPPVTVLSLVSRSTTSTDTIEWVRVATFDNAAVEVAEGEEKPQSDLTYEIVQTPVQTIAHWIAATRQALADAARLRDDIDTYLRAGIEQRLELEILKGDGTAPNLRGILNTTGILTASAGGSPVESIFAGISAIQAQNYQPSAVLMNPADFGGIRLAKDGNDNYYYGPPNVVGPATVWGLPIVTSPNMTAGSALVADFAQATLWTREGVTVVASSEHADFFIKNLVAILAEGRWAFGVRVPKAFCLVDLA